LKVEKLKKFWKNKRVLIIGHTGFTGSWLTIFLNHLGSSVSGYSLSSEKQHIIFNILKLKNKIKNNCFGDINNSPALFNFIKKTGPEIIINLAAQSLVRKSYFEPIETYKTNVMGAINLLNICRNIKGIKVILTITTDKVYLNKEINKSYKENDALGGLDPYSSSKAASEIAIHSFDKSFFNKQDSAYIATARSGNIIGGGDWSEDRLIPDLIKSHISRKKFIVRMPDAIRPWQHVLEAVWGYIILCQKLYQRNKIAKGAWNFGPNSKNFLKVKELIKKITSISNFKIKYKTKKSYLFESKILKLNNSKSKKNLGWTPILSINQMINFTISWYELMIQNKKKLYDLTIMQIEFFIKKIKKKNFVKK
jgi:CDP-glucose 4,6-dehydratase